MVTNFIHPSLQSYAVIDTIIWKTTQGGNYTVKLAYHICVDLLLLSPASAQNNTLGMNIWNLKIPPRVRSFLWRLTQQCLPPRTNLNTKGTPCKESCVMCESFVETHMHIFFACTKAKEFQENIGLENVIRELLLQSINFTILLFDFFFDRLSSQQQQIVVMLIWSLWKSRNTKL